MTPQELSAFEKLGNGQGAFEGEARKVSAPATALRAIIARRVTHTDQIQPRTLADLLRAELVAVYDGMVHPTSKGIATADERDGTWWEDGRFSGRIVGGSHV